MEDIARETAQLAIVATGKQDDDLSDVGSELSTDFTEKSWREDLALIVEDRKLFVSKAILSLVSPVFDRMFQGEFKEKDQDEVALPGKKFKDMQEFLRCVYPINRKSVSMENIERVMPLAEEYQATELTSACEKILLETATNTLSEKTMDRVIQLALVYDKRNILRQFPIKTAEAFLMKNAQGETSIVDKDVLMNCTKELKKLRQENAYYTVVNKMNSYDITGDATGFHDNATRCGTVVHITLNEGFSNKLSADTVFQLADYKLSCTVELIPYQFNPYESSNFLLVFRTEMPLETERYRLKGRLVVKNASSKENDQSQMFEYSFSGSEREVQVTFPKDLTDPQEGFVYFGKMDLDIYLICCIEKVYVPPVVDWHEIKEFS